MSLLESRPGPVSWSGPGGGGWRDRFLDALLPHRGAIANARFAEERDRAAASQRRQAGLALAARASGHPVGTGRRTAP